MVANNIKQMVSNYSNSIIVNSSHQSPVTSARQLLIKLIHPFVAQYCSKSPKILRCSVNCFSFFFIFSTEFHPATIFVYTV